MSATIEGLDEKRRKHQKFRADVLSGDWSGYVTERIKRDVGIERAREWGDADTNSNVARTIVEAQAVVHDRSGFISHDTPSAAQVMGEVLKRADWWPLSQRIESDMVGLNDVLCHVDTDEAGGVVLTPIRPHCIRATAHPRAPRSAARVRWEQMRPPAAGGVPEAVFDTWDITVPGSEFFRCEDEHGTDVSAKFGVTPLQGKTYRWRRADGRAIIPIAWWHRYLTDGLWSPYVNAELFHATVSIAADLTYYHHLNFRASWAQRYTAGLSIQGERLQDGTDDVTTLMSLKTGSTGRAAAIVADPAVVLSLTKDPDYGEGQPVVGQWGVSSQPAEVLEGIIARVQWVATEFGGPSSEVSGANHDARSAYAIVMSRAAQREAAQRLEPACRRGDLELLSVVATVLRVHGGPSLPEDGWAVEYTPLPITQEELTAEREQLDWEMSKRLAGPISAYTRLHPGTNEDEALAALVQVGMETARLDAALQAALVTAGLAAPAPEAEAASGVVIAESRAIVKDVVDGLVPRESGIAELTELVRLTPEQAEAVMSTAGAGFKTEEQNNGTAGNPGAPAPGRAPEPPGSGDAPGPDDSGDPSA